MVHVIWPAKAQRWLRNIHDYIAEDNPKAAQRVMRGILAKAEKLSRFPYLGAPYRGDSSSDLRVLVHGHYRIIYRIVGDEVRIQGVFHGRMDINRHLRLDEE